VLSVMSSVRPPHEDVPCSRLVPAAEVSGRLVATELEGGAAYSRVAAAVAAYPGPRVRRLTCGEQTFLVPAPILRVLGVGGVSTHSPPYLHVG